MSSYTTVSIDPEFDFDLSGSGLSHKSRLTSPIHPFKKRRSRIYGQLKHTVQPLLSLRSARRTLAFIIFNLLIIFILLSWCKSTNSLALRSFAYLTVFDFFTLITCMISIWSTANQISQSEEGTIVFNYERIEVVSVFSSVVLASLGSIFILKECIIRIIDQPEVSIGRLLPGLLVGFLFHVMITLSVNNKPLQCITNASQSSVLQEHMADMSQTLCSIIPALSKILLPRINPFLLTSFIGASLIFLTNLLIQMNLYYFADTVSAILISTCTLCTMWPVASCSARVLLNTTPPYLLGQLDKLLSEAQTLDGVLEIRNERFYTVSLSVNNKKRYHNGLTMVGSINVRVRRDADEQMVLAHVTHRLSTLVSHLTVQVSKDDWGSVPMVSSGVINIPRAVRSTSGSKPSSASSSIIYGFNKPAAAVAPMPHNPSKYTTTIAEKKSADDFSFAPTKSKPQIKSLAPPSAGSNIARMYKAAGFSTPPPSKPSTNMLKQVSGTKLATGILSSANLKLTKS
uniref:zinc transporter 6 n=1 Tax=Ciona intestinalis TaxID=7719 RepID=UPI000180D318|nr:zinc transporter 6 [Ciona intestinalis]|eukprot:XP_002121319.1 zinc transporter 6 [Ciona intestinalis]